MNSLSGFIKLHRKLVAWGWYQDYVVKDVFLHLLLIANFKATPWKGRVLDEGQVVVGTQKLADELGFSRQQVRTALKKLKSTNEITIEATNRFSIITIVNWRDYQCEGKTPTSKITNIATNKQPTDNQQATNKQPQRKNGKNVKNDKNGKKRGGTPVRTPYGEFQNVYLSDDELANLRTRYPFHYEAKIERMSRYQESRGKDYHNQYATLLDWLEKDTAKEQPKTNSSYDISTMDEIDTLDFIDLD